MTGAIYDRNKTTWPPPVNTVSAVRLDSECPLRGSALVWPGFLDEHYVILVLELLCVDRSTHCRIARDELHGIVNITRHKLDLACSCAARRLDVVV